MPVIAAAIVALCAVQQKPAPPKPKPAKPKAPRVTKPKLPPAPQGCITAIDDSAKIFDGAIALLQAEANKREDGQVERGVQAFQAYLAEHRPALAAIRAKAVEVHKTLTKDDRALCERRAYKVLHKSLTRFAGVASFYHSRIDVFRTVGDLFR